MDEEKIAITDKGILLVEFWKLKRTVTLLSVLIILVLIIVLSILLLK